MQHFAKTVPQYRKEYRISTKYRYTAHPYVHMHLSFSCSVIDISQDYSPWCVNYIATSTLVCACTCNMYMYMYMYMYTY